MTEGLSISSARAELSKIAEAGGGEFPVVILQGGNKRLYLETVHTFQGIDHEIIALGMDDNPDLEPFSVSRTIAALNDFTTDHPNAFAYAICRNGMHKPIIAMAANQECVTLEVGIDG